MYQCLLGGQSDFKFSLTIRKQAVKVETRLMSFWDSKNWFPYWLFESAKSQHIEILMDQKSSEKIYLFVRKEYSQYTF